MFENELDEGFDNIFNSGSSSGVILAIGKTCQRLGASPFPCGKFFGVYTQMLEKITLFFRL